MSAPVNMVSQYTYVSYRNEKERITMLSGAMKDHLTKLMLQGIDKTSLIFWDVMMTRSTVILKDSKTGYINHNLHQKVMDGPYSIEELWELIGDPEKEISNIDWADLVNRRLMTFQK